MTQADAPTEGSKPAARPAKRTWWQRLRRLAWLAFLVAVVLRVLLWLLLPWIVDWGAGAAGYTARYHRLGLTLLGGHVQVDGLAVHARQPDGEPDLDAPLLRVDHADVDLDVSALLTGTVRLHTVEADGLETWITVDGSAEPEPEPEPEPAAAEPPDDPDATAPLDLGLPVEITRLRVQHVQVHLRDTTVTPAVDAQLHADLHAEQLGVPGRDANLKLLVRMPGVLDALDLEAHGGSGGAAAHASLTLEVDGLHLAPLRGYLEPAGVRPHAERLDLGLAANLALHALDEQGLATGGELTLSGLALRADGAEQTALDQVRVEVGRADRALVQIPEVTLRGLRGMAEQLADGTLRVAGVDLVAAAPAPEPGAEPDQEDAPAGGGPNIAVDLVRLTEGALRWRDAAVQPSVAVALALEELTARNLRLPPVPGEKLRVHAKLSAPDLAALDLSADVQLLPELVARATLRGERLGLTPVAPYLKRAGLAPTLADGSFTADLEARVASDPTAGTLRADVTLRDLALRQPGAEPGSEQSLLALAQLAVRDVLAGPDHIRVGEVEIAGLQMPVQIDQGGALRLLGIRTVPAPAPATAAAPPAAAPPPPAPPTVAAAPAAPLRLEVGRVHWHDSQLAFVDRSRLPAIQVDTKDIGLDLRGLVLGALEPTPPAQLRLWLIADDLTDTLELSGTIATQPGPLDLTADLALRGRGLRAGALAPYFQAAGVEPLFDDAELALDLRASVRQVEDGLDAELALRDLGLRQAGSTLVGLGALTVDGVRVRGDAVDVDSVRLADVELYAARDADGGLRVAGVRLPPPKATEPLPDTQATPGEQPPAPAAAAPTETAATPLRLARLAVEGVALHWRDAAVAPAVATTVQLAAGVEQLALGAADAPPARFTLTLGVRDALDALTLEGTAAVSDPDDLSLRAELVLRGLRAGPLAAYLPPGQPMTLADGRLRLTLAADVDQLAEGGRALRAEVQGFDYRDGDAATPLLAFDAFTVAVPRLDADGGVFEVGEVALAGLEAHARRAPDGVLHALGFALPPATEPAADAALTPGAPAATSGFRRIAQRARRDPNAPLPRVELGRFDLELRRLVFLDETRPGAAPLVARARLSTPGPTTLLAADPTVLAPVELMLDAGLEPVVGDLDLALTLAPFADRPSAALRAAARGLRGTGLTEALPALASTLDGTELDDGTFDLQLVTYVDARRRGPAEFDLSRGFGAELEVSELALRARPDGPVVAGLGGLTVDVRRIVPDTGDVHVRSVEVVKPIGKVVQGKDGLHLLGLVLKPAPLPEPGEVELDLVDPVPAAAPARVAARPAGPPPEFRLDELAVSGVDFEFRDETADPPFVLPLDGLDLEVRGFTTKAFRERRPVRFSASVTAGEIDLPKRIESLGFGLGFAQAAVAALAGQSDEVEIERRRALDEIALNGRLAFAPVLEGKVKFNLTGFELPAFRGPASQAGVEIGDGVLDFGTTLRFRGAEGLDVDTGVTFTHLSISEPAGGPISTYLQLPAPLDTVLFALRNEDGEHRLAPSVHLAPGGISGAEIARVAVQTLAEQIASAVAAAPLRMASVVTDVTGLTGGDDDLQALITSVRFGGGDAALPPDAATLLAPLLDEVAGDDELSVVLSHDFGPEDLTRAERMANPTPGECRALVARLRHRAAELRRERGAAVAAARGALIAGRPADNPRSRQLRTADAELGTVEQAIDRMLGLLAPGAERRADKRTRAAARAIAERRLAALREAVIERLQVLGVDNAIDRVEARRARFAAPVGEGGGRVLATPKRRQAQ